jgi:hypothetical protein
MFIASHALTFPSPHQPLTLRAATPKINLNSTFELCRLIQSKAHNEFQKLKRIIRATCMAPQPSATCSMEAESG